MTADELNLNEDSLRLLKYLLEKNFGSAKITIRHGQIVEARVVERIIQAKDFERPKGT